MPAADSVGGGDGPARPCKAQQAGEGAIVADLDLETSAPGTDPKVTVTDASRTFRPMSTIRPLPIFRPPKTGLPR